MAHKNKETERFFINFLTSKKLRLTKQRRLIFEEFINATTHIDTDELFARIKAVDKNIGLATIYRTLKLLVDSGIVREVKPGNGKPAYEAVAGRAHHDHLICSICGRNVEFKDDAIEELQKQIASTYGYKLTGHSLYLEGICPECAKKGSGANEESEEKE